MKARTCHPVNRSGSALILTVVLTTLLAVVGVAFLLMSRVDNMATTAQHENRELDFAAKSVVDTISDVLVRDVPGVAAAAGSQGAEYWDIDWTDDPWLASIEPYDANEGTGTAPDYRWRQISDATSYLRNRGGGGLGRARFATRNIPIEITSSTSDPNGQFNAIIPDRKPLVLDANGVLEDQLADADGDGVADSKWVMLSGVVSGRSMPIFAAIRIIDNGAMLNVDTAYKFYGYDPNERASDIDGSSLMQVNLMGLSWRPGYSFYDPNKEMDLLFERSNYGLVDPCNLQAYRRNVVWRYDSPLVGYTPFDISDELEMRNRYVVNNTSIDTRLEVMGNNVTRPWDFRTIQDMRTPVDNAAKLADWFKTTYTSGIVDPNIDPNYAYRHLVTTYNMDRIINPTVGLADPALRVNSGRQADVNRDSAPVLYNAVRAALWAGGMGMADPNALAAQLAVNIVDYRDRDVNVTTLTVPTGPNSVPRSFIGFEPQPFISEIASRISGTDPNDPTNNYFALELYNPFDVNIPLSNFRLDLRRPNGAIVSSLTFGVYVIRANDRFVIANSAAAITGFGITGVNTGRAKVDSRLVLATYASDPNVAPNDPPRFLLVDHFDICLMRPTVVDPNVYLDRQVTSRDWFDWGRSRDIFRYFSRPDNNWNIIYQDDMAEAGATLGSDNTLNGNKRNYNLLGGNRDFVTVGDISRVLTVGPSGDPNDMLGVRVQNQPGEAAIRFDLGDETFANIFQYVTCLDPNNDGIDNDGDGLIDSADTTYPEWKIPGRVNLNTAPWFVIAQLPWIQANTGFIDPSLAKSIVRQRYRSPFVSTGSLLDVVGIDRYSRLQGDLTTFPDLTPADGCADDFEERDVIFSRVSNVATVRSDVFTAYIVVRIGTDGPQKRVMAILDRSDVYGPADKVKIRAYQTVPDPR